MVVAVDAAVVVLVMVGRVGRLLVVTTVAIVVESLECGVQEENFLESVGGTSEDWKNQPEQERATHPA